MKKFLLITILSVIFHNTVIQPSVPNENTLRSAASPLFALRTALTTFQSDPSNLLPLENAVAAAIRSRDALVRIDPITYSSLIEKFNNLIANATDKLAILK